MDLGIWLHCVDHDPEGILKAITPMLERAGFTTMPFDPAMATGMGLLLFTDSGVMEGRQIEHLIWEWSEGGLHRVLIVCSGTNAADDRSWQFLHAGASDVLYWDELGNPDAEITSRFIRWARTDEIVSTLAPVSGLIGTSPVWISLLRRVVEVAHFTEASVLLLGETGTGKEQVARLIHDLDCREGKKEFVLLDCSTVVPELSGSEFFGHERGAFTGAVSPRDGAFALAHEGTLFLDEIGELTAPLQAQLLRVVQEHSYKRVGGNAWRQTNFRLVSATHRDLISGGATGAFRPDLYYRLAGWVCQLPPLRERPSDILPLARHFIQQHFPGRPCPVLAPAVEQVLLSRQYPGNVRDLKQLASRIALRHVGPGPISVGDIPEDERPPYGESPAPSFPGAFYTAVSQALSHGAHLKEIGRFAEDSAIRIVTSEEHGNLQRAAQRLGVTDRALQLRRAAHRGEISHLVDRKSG